MTLEQRIARKYTDAKAAADRRYMETPFFAHNLSGWITRHAVAIYTREDFYGWPTRDRGGEVEC